MTAVFLADVALVALDWQHPSYWFWPHRQAVESEPWRISPFPGGDYHAFLTQDLEQGTFGHPWEQTICVFGRDLTEVLVRAGRLAAIEAQDLNSPITTRTRCEPELD